MKQIKYTYITKNTTRTIFWTGTLTGALLYVLMGSYADFSGNLIAKGLETVGIIIIASTIAFCTGILFKIKEIKHI